MDLNSVAGCVVFQQVSASYCNLLCVLHCQWTCLQSAMDGCVFTKAKKQKEKMGHNGTPRHATKVIAVQPMGKASQQDAFCFVSVDLNMYFVQKIFQFTLHGIAPTIVSLLIFFSVLDDLKNSQSLKLFRCLCKHNRKKNKEKNNSSMTYSPSKESHAYKTKCKPMTKGRKMSLISALDIFVKSCRFLMRKSQNQSSK